MRRALSAEDDLCATVARTDDWARIRCADAGPVRSAARLSSRLPGSDVVASASLNALEVETGT
jgi:hypothetical protein